MKTKTCLKHIWKNFDTFLDHLQTPPLDVSFFIPSKWKFILSQTCKIWILFINYIRNRGEKEQKFPWIHLKKPINWHYDLVNNLGGLCFFRRFKLAIMINSGDKSFSLAIWMKAELISFTKIISAKVCC